MTGRAALAIAFLAATCSPAPAGPDASAGVFQWSELPQLPPARKQARQIGLAGPFAGVHNDALIVAGGANFPDGRPWQRLPDGSPPRKIYHKDIFVLTKADDGPAERRPDGSEIADGPRYRWVHPEIALDQPVAYGVSIATPAGLVCLGGEQMVYRTNPQTREVEGVKELSDRVFVLRWDPAAGRLRKADKLVAERDDPNEVLALPPLPSACTAMAGATVGEVIYLAGGDGGSGATRNFWALDLAKRKQKREFVWRQLPPWPGPPRVHAVLAAQSDGTTDCLYLFSGRDERKGSPTAVLTDAYRFDPKAYGKGRAGERGPWRKLGRVQLAGEEPRCVMAGVGIASGANHILIFGGDDGALFIELERTARAVAALRAQAAAQADPAAREKLRTAAEAKDAARRKALDTHQGFGRDVLAYHTVTDTWVKVDRAPGRGQVTTPAVRWGESVVIPSGEIRPGVRTPRIWKASPRRRRQFGPLNYLVLGAYLLALVGMGVYFSRRGRTTEDYFKAGRRVPWWAAGLSIFGTQLSALTFMAIPAKTFATDWRYFIGNMTIVMVAPLIVLLFLPFYRRLDVTTAYEYLERRFNLATRLLGSVMFMLFQFGRIGIVLFLPSLALSVVTGMNVSLCIVVMGVLCVFYTVLGGIEAVIWTDVLQVVVLLGGAVLCLVLIPFQVSGGWSGINDIADASDKLRMLDFRFDLTTATFWVMVFGGLGANIISYGSDQTVIQRYLTTRNEKLAAWGIWTNAILCIPASLLFFGIGTALFVFYKAHPGQLDPTIGKPDAIFPLFIVTRLPAGISGLLIAALFAAAMSSLDSSMNSVATAFTTDFYRRFRPGAADRSCLRLARLATVAVGLLGTAFALTMAQWKIKSLWDQFATFLGLFGGGLGGLFLLAILTRRAHGIGAIVGLAASGIVQFAIQRFYPLHPWFYAVTGIVSCFAIGYVASLLIPAGAKRLDGLTLHTIRGGAAGGGT